jgi:hypothetical protein
MRLKAMVIGHDRSVLWADVARRKRLSGPRSERVE